MMLTLRKKYFCVLMSYLDVSDSLFFFFEGQTDCVLFTNYLLMRNGWMVDAFLHVQKIVSKDRANYVEGVANLFIYLLLYSTSAEDL